MWKLREFYTLMIQEVLGTIDFTHEHLFMDCAFTK